MKEFKLKYGDKVKLCIDFESAVLEDIDFSIDCESIELEYNKLSEIPGIWEYMCENMVFTIDRMEAIKGYSGNTIHLYFLKELPNLRFVEMNLEKTEL